MRLLGLVLLLGCAFQGAFGASAVPTWGYLDNGMAYVLLESHAAPLVGSTVVVHAGAAREDFATSGASHFLEHLLFNGTKTRTQEQLYADVDAIGGYNNATTRKTHVVYMMVTPAEKIRAGMEIQADMIFNSTLPADKVEKERGIILEEFSKDLDAGGLSLERALDLGLFGPGGDGLPVLGSPQSIRAMSRDTILSFYQNYYTPQNMTLMIVGDFVSSSMEQEVREVFGSIPAGLPVPTHEAITPRWDDLPVVFSHSGSDLAVEWTYEGPAPRSAEFLSFTALTDLLAGDESSDFNRMVRAAFPQQVIESSGRLELAPERSYLRLRLMLDASADWPSIVEAIPSIIAQARALPSEEDLAAWKVAREADEFYLRERPHYYGIMRGEDISVRGVSAIVDEPSRLRALRHADLGRSLPGWASGVSRVVVALPQASGGSQDTTAARGRAVRSVKLDNGLDLLVLSSPESPVLALHLFIRGRSQAEPPGMDGSAELLHRLMAVRTADSPPEELSRRLRAIGAELKTADDPSIPYDDFYSTGAATFVRLQTLDAHVDEALQILAEMLRVPPSWSDAEFDAARKSMLSASEKSTGSSGARARQLIRESLYPGSWRARPVFGTPASLTAIGPEDLRRFASQYFVGNRMLLVVATSLPLDRIEASVRSVLGSIRPGSPPPELNDRRGALEAVRGSLSQSDMMPPVLSGLVPRDSTLIRAEHVGGRQAAITWVRFLGVSGAADLPAIEVWNSILSAAIQFQLREREGLAYSLGSSVDRMDDGRVVWTASAASGTENLARILEGFDQAFQRALEQVPAVEDVQRQGYQAYGRSLMRRATRMNQAYAAGLAFLEGRDPSAIDDEIRAPSLVRATDVSAVLPRLVPAGPSILAVAY